MRQWFICPVCKKKLMQFETGKEFEGIYFQCPKCKREIEITNKEESKSQTPVAS